MENISCILDINTSDTAETVDPMLFGFNLEITRETWYNGISAQIINNRKFYSCDGNTDTAGWQLINGAEKTAEGIKLINGACVIQLLHSAVGIDRRTLDWRVCVLGNEPVRLKIKIGKSETSFLCDALCGEKRTVSGKITAELSESENCFSVEALDGEITLCCVSLMPEDGTVLGLREDVISSLKALKPPCLRFPGGCYAEYYDWKEGLLPPDERRCMSIDDNAWLRGIVLGPTFGQDPQDMNIDDFAELCRMTGAEPQYTVRLNENTPEDAARLVEYANGDSSSEYGKLRISRGHEKPYGIKRWYIGNELYYFGRGEMKDPKAVAKRSVEFAVKMKEADPDIELILCCNIGSEWNTAMVNTVNELGGTELFSYMSYHQYLLDVLFSKDHNPDEVNEPGTEEGIRRVEDILKAPTEYMLPNLRAAHDKQKEFGSLFEKLPMSYDEWNYYWGRSGHPALALFTAGMLQVFVNHAAELNMKQALFFHPVNEGIMRVTQNGVIMEDGGLVWKLISAHRGGMRTVISSDNPAIDAAATLHGNRTYITVINRDSRRKAEVRIPGMLKGRSVVSEAYSADSIWEKAYCANSLHTAEIGTDAQNDTVVLPPSCAAGLWIE